MTTFLRSSLALSSFGLLLGVAGCPGTTTTEDAASSLDAASVDATPSGLDDAHVEADAPSGGDVGTDALASVDAPGTDAPSLDAASADAPGLDAPRPDAPGPDAPGAVSLTLVEPYAYGNCFMGPSDPLLASWTIRATGPAGERVEVESASLRVRVEARSYDTTQELTLDAPGFDIPVGGTIDHMQRKSSGTPSVPICMFCSDTVVGELTLQVTTSSGPRSLTETLDLGCVF